MKQRDLFLTAIVQEIFHQGGEGRKIFTLGFLIGMDKLPAVTMRSVNLE